MMRFRRFIASFLLLCMMGMAVPMQARAAIVTTDAITAAADRERVTSLLARDDVRGKLEAAGVKSTDVQARVDALSNDEVTQLAAQIDSLPAGGDGILGALVLIFVVLVITDLIGLTHIFPFSRRR